MEVSNGSLFDFLSELLVLEKGSVNLLGIARDRIPRLDIQQFLEDFVSAGQRQVDALAASIRELGGNPVYVSPSAQIQYQRITSVSHLQTPASLQELADLENCWYAALQENIHLAFVRSILPFLVNSRAQEILMSLLNDAAKVQENRLEWLEQALHRLLLQRALAPLEGTDMSTAA